MTKKQVCQHEKQTFYCISCVVLVYHSVLYRHIYEHFLIEQIWDTKHPIT